MRVDPSDSGGMFVGRRPGTKPVRYRSLPTAGDARRQRVDRGIARALLAAMSLVNLAFWGPLPVAWLWVGSHVQYWTDSVTFAIFVAFAGLIGTLLLALVALKRLDQAWILVRRAAGYDQREGTLGRIFVITCGVGTACFTAWLLLFSGAELAPVGIHI